MDAVDPAGQDPRQIGLAQRQRQPAQIVAVGGQAVEGIELHLAIALAAVQGVEVGDAVASSRLKIL
jgi:hypothetical protein